MSDITAFIIASITLSALLLFATTHYSLRIFFARLLNRPPNITKLMNAYIYALGGIVLYVSGSVVEMYTGVSVFEKVLKTIASMFFIYAVYTTHFSFRPGPLPARSRARRTGTGIGRKRS